ncbi:head maturation protease [Mycobacterium phage Che9c]|uniref:Prohead serine protease domain-containing protein n=1 Tax=Mycobacterium phage Che9c TaxID=2907832 RepID=Q854Z3_9CAUD|nr:head maturation protease [Mycobacterium phage Che9c]AAN12565.1 hypothetical protein PBI_CHE9C_5 [Mycobacterium phage Che9c]
MEVRMTTATKRAARPPLESVRQAPFTLRDAGEDGEPNDGLTLDGYGAVFNRLTVIDSYEGKFREKIAPGAMKRSFRESPPKVQFDHGRHPMIGSIPIASLRSIAEEVDPVLAPEGGAHVVARVFDNWLMAPVRDAIAGKAIDGMSFRFSVVREQWESPDGKIIRDEQQLMEELRRTWYEDVPEEELLVRTLKELKVPEIGPVTWPAYADTSVSMRSKVIDLGRLHDPEQRKLLAEAVFIADAVSQDEAAQRDASDDESHADEAETPESPAVEHPAESDDAQRSTRSEPSEPVGEHPSTPRRFSDMKLRLMNQRDRLLNLRAVGERP